METDEQIGADVAAQLSADGAQPAEATPEDQAAAAGVDP